MSKLFAALAAFSLCVPATLAGEACPCQEKQCNKSDGNVAATDEYALHATTQLVSYDNSGSDKKAGSGSKGPDIVDAAVGNNDFATLVAAVKAAGLVDALKGKGPFTVFAPTNAAFERLPDETLAALLKPEGKQQLTDILLYHVVPGKVLAKDVVNVKSADTLLKGKKVSVRVKGSNVYIDGARVTKTDLQVSNGVIHVIDTVILPK